MAETTRLHQVSLLAAASYAPELLDAVVEEHFGLLRLDALLRPGMHVLLKPNLLMMRAPDTATTTHPELAAAVARALKRRGICNITLADSPGGPYTPALLNPIYKASGMAEMAQREGVTLNLSTASREVATGLHRVTTFHIIEPVVQADLVINLCKLKTHCMTGLSGAVKNLFGCVPGLQKPEFHYRFQKPDDFCDMLIDLCETVRPAITFVDAVDSMEGDGPSGGSALHTGLVLCGTNPYDLDRVLCKLIHMPEAQAQTVKASIARGLAVPLEQIELLGDASLLHSVEKFQLPATKSHNFNTHLPKWMQGAATFFTDRVVVPRPVIHKVQCIGCGKCAQSCPAKTISITGGKAVIGYSSCIKCYCCHEMCPVKAITIHKNSLMSH